MSATSLPFLHQARPAQLALAFLLLAAATILGALAFEHIGGYQPCALCLMQRLPYYLGMPVAAVTLAALMMNAPRVLVMALFAAMALLALYNAGLGAYHSGIEWEFWQGPESCSGTGDVGGNILDRLQNETAPSCTDAVWRMFGLSFAGWNVVVSLLLTGFAVTGLSKLRQPAG